MKDVTKGNTPLFDLDIEAYHADTSRISSTGLRFLHRSPLHYYAAFLDPARTVKPPTPAMLMGTYIHCALLEPEVFTAKYTCLNDEEIIRELAQAGVKNPRNTKKYEEWKEAFKRNNAERELIPFDDYRTVVAIHNAVMSRPFIASLLSDILPEKSINFTDPESGAACRMRPDGINMELMDCPVIIEMKTCENAAPAVFGKQVLYNNYYNQAAFYIDGLTASGFTDRKPEHVFLAIERDPPYASALYMMPDSLIETGRKENATDLKTYVFCKDSDYWPGYADEVMPLLIPAWAVRI